MDEFDLNKWVDDYETYEDDVALELIETLYHKPLTLEGNINELY